ncbi:MAG: hypothetical protein HY693_03725 [Deltaproteobacteria bacterium]|nr:hypothetical protein [Deltaproteobacteria bacterium]
MNKEMSKNPIRRHMFDYKSLPKLLIYITLASSIFESSSASGNTFDNIIINEVDSDTPGTDMLEFVELYDGGIGNTDLTSFVVVFYNGATNTSYAALDLDGFTTDENGYFLIGQSGVSPSPDIIFRGIQNGADAVALYMADGSDFPNGTPVTIENLIDAIVYDTDDADDPELLVLLNDGQPQVNENGGGDKDNHSNSRCPNGRGGARNTDGYVQTNPTPASDNVCAPVLEVEVDVKPGIDTNIINCNNTKGVIPVAILSTEVFDATTVDHSTVSFEGACEAHVNIKTGELRRHEEDVDGNGYIDLVFHFLMGDSNLDCDSIEGTIRGETFDGQAFEGSDSLEMFQ